MLKKLSLLDMHVAMKNRIEDATDLRVIDKVSVNEPSPFTFLQFVGNEEKNTKTMFIDEFTIHVHIISAAASNSIAHYQNIQAVQEALTEYIHLPEGYTVWGQVASGLISNFTEETAEEHAVLSFVFKISYGFKIKL